MPEKVAIIGSRQFPMPELVEAFVASMPEGTTVISGGAEGVDTVAEKAARRRGLPTIVLVAEWSRLGRKAGHIRNEQVVAAADSIVAFWNGASRGTLHTIVIASENKKPIRIFTDNGTEIALAEALEAAERVGVIDSIRAAWVRSRA